ncbi:MAG: hypothetical protein JWM11_8016, partial [Planctomycetaceae bacterium]|nr:hypothetical protein [Planctomycetaceae bacterium]
MEPSQEELERKRLWFDWYIYQQSHNSEQLPPEGGPYC